MSTTEREAFEAWIRQCEGHPFARQFAQLMWKAWQARAALSTPPAAQAGAAILALSHRMDDEAQHITERQVYDFATELRVLLGLDGPAAQAEAITTPCAGPSCGTTTAEHSPECRAEHAAAVAGGRSVVTADEARDMLAHACRIEESAGRPLNIATSGAAVLRRMVAAAGSLHAGASKPAE